MHNFNYEQTRCFMDIIPTRADIPQKPSKRTSPTLSRAELRRLIADMVG